MSKEPQRQNLAARALAAASEPSAAAPVRNERRDSDVFSSRVMEFLLAQARGRALRRALRAPSPWRIQGGAIVLASTVGNIA